MAEITKLSPPHAVAVIKREKGNCIGLGWDSLRKLVPSNKEKFFFFLKVRESFLIVLYTFFLFFFFENA